MMTPWHYQNHFGGAPFSPYYPQYIAPQPGYVYAMPSAPPALTNASTVEDTEDTEDHTPTRAGAKNNRRAA